MEKQCAVRGRKRSTAKETGGTGILPDGVPATKKKLLLENLDSLYSAFYKKAAQRLAKGESNVLEKASAETQLGQIHIQQQQLQQDFSVLQLAFQLLLNTNAAFVPGNENTTAQLLTVADSSVVCGK
jgi:outer membrane protein TolC